MATVKELLTNVANNTRKFLGTEEQLSLEGMSQGINEASAESDFQTELIEEFSTILDRSVAPDNYVNGKEDGFADALAKRTDLVATENGDYLPEGESTGFKSVKVEVKSTERKRKAVSFVDYDGYVLYTYSVEEIKAMTELPQLPEHEGLICEGWNWTLDEIKQYIADFESDSRYLFPFDVGAIYTTDDGRSRFVINLDDEDGVGCDVWFGFDTGDYYEYVYVDWGDGGEEQKFHERWQKEARHTYAKGGRYTISVRLLNSNVKLENGGSGMFHNVINSCVLEEAYLGDFVTIEEGMFIDQRLLKIVTIPNRITSIGNAAFQKCASLKNVNLPSNITHIGSTAFTGAGVKRMTLPSQLQTIGNYVFGNSNSSYGVANVEHITSRSPINLAYVAQYVHTLKEVNLPKSMLALGSGAFRNADAMRRFYAPSALETIANYVFYGCVPRLLDFSACRKIPTVESSTFETHYTKEIRVPLHMLEAWKVATNWSAHASKMVGVEVPWANEPVEEEM